MRRYFLYLAIALLAFGIGLFAVLKFYWITEEKPISKKENIVATETQPEKYVGRGYGEGYGRLNEPVSEPQQHKATCSDKKLLPIWNELRKDKEFKESDKEFLSGSGLFECNRDS